MRSILAVGLCLAAFTGCSDQATRNLIDKQTDQTKQGIADAAHPQRAVQALQSADRHR